MRRSPILPLVFVLGLLLYLPAGLAAQQPAPGIERLRLTRRVSALRLQAMLRAPYEVSAARTVVRTLAAGAAPQISAPAIRLVGRTIWIPLSGPLALRAGMSWWSTGIRTSAGFSLRF